MRQLDVMPVPTTLESYAQTISVGDLQLHSYVGGNGGSPIVLVHGLGDEADTWRRLFPTLAEERTTVAFDLPGFGRSDKPRRYYTLAFFARTLQQLLAALGVKKATLVGHSLGAAIVQRLTIAHPELVERLVLIDGCLPFTQRLPAAPLWAFLTPGIGELGYTSLRRSQDEAYATLRPFYRDLDALSEEDRTFLRDRVWARVWSNGQRRGFLSAFRWLNIDSYLRAATFRKQIAQLATPTDIIWGGHDLLQPATIAKELATIVPDGRLHILPDAGHNAHQECPDEIARIILQRP